MRPDTSSVPGAQDGAAAGPASDQVVPGNRWDRLEVGELGSWTPSRRLAVVLPYYEAPGALENTLTALARQTYPAELTQIVVADDGSSPPLRLPARHRGLDVSVVRQPDRGFGLARARNTGAAATDADILVFLDCDMVPEPQHLEAHARWHHACTHAVTLGFRQHVDFSGIGPEILDGAIADGSLEQLFSDRPRTRPTWLDRHMERMRELTAEHDDLFRATTGGNLGIRSALFDAVGGFDATFDQWGSEDTDIGHRLFLAGAVLVPERRAACWHQGDSRGLEPHERVSLRQQRARISQTVPHPGFRRVAPGRSFTIPRVLVVVDGTDRTHAAITATVESVLASDLHDLEVVLAIPDEHPDGVVLRREWSGDPRVLEEERPDHARCPYRLRLPVGARLLPHALDAVVATMSDPDEPVGVLHVPLAGARPDERGLAVSTRALARARRSGADDELATAGRLFGERTLEGAQLGIDWAPVTALRRVPRPTPPGADPGTAGAGPRSPLAPWLLVDSALGWVTRGEVGDLLADADRQIAEARDQAVDARYDRDRLRNRRAVRVALELAGTAGGEGLRSLPARLRSAAAPTEDLPPPATSAPTRTVRRAGRDLERRALPRPASERNRTFPHLRVLHLGAAGRFLTLADHTVIRPDTWREQLREGADLVLVEPPAGTTRWDPLGGDLPALLDAARELGVPTVRLSAPSTAPGPGGPALELVEAAAHDGAVTQAAGRGIIPPSIDTSVLNPTDWRRQPPDPVVAVLDSAPDPAARRFLAGFDPPVVLVHPPDLPSPADLGDLTRVVSSPGELKRSLVRAGVLLDDPAWREPTETLRLWMAALACGTPVVAIDGRERVPAPPGVTMVTADEAPEAVHRLLVDADLRERHGIVGRRWALTAGSRETALRTILERLEIPLPGPPRTTVLLATNRPDYLERGLANVARQQQPGVDVSLVLHGAAFDGVDVPDRDGLVTSAVRAPDAWLLGDCLNAALDAARGELIAKMDDDDHYGPEHLRDLVTAWHYSGADVVGKRVEYVHLATRGVTLRRPTSAPERDRRHVGGPTLLAARETLRRYRFLRVPNRVDSTLYERVLDDGGRVYGIHSRDLVLERHGDGHAWAADDQEFLAQAIEVRDGLDLGLASSDPATGS